MTVSVENPFASTTAADGVQVSFPIGFTYSDPADVQVEVITAGVTTVPAYLVVGTNIVLDVAPAAGATVRRWRDTPAEQPASFPASGDFPSTSFERQLDRLTRSMQEVWRALGECLRLPVGDSALVLPLAAQRAGKLIGFDDAGALAMFASQSITSRLFSYSATAVGAIAAGDFVHLYDNAGVRSATGATGSDPTKFASGFAVTSAANGGLVLLSSIGVNDAIAMPTSTAPIYLSDSVAGGFTTSPPTADGHIVQCLGLAVAGLGIIFNPQPAVIL